MDGCFHGYYGPFGLRGGWAGGKDHGEEPKIMGEPVFFSLGGKMDAVATEGCHRWSGSRLQRRC